MRLRTESGARALQMATRSLQIGALHAVVERARDLTRTHDDRRMWSTLTGQGQEFEFILLGIAHDDPSIGAMARSGLTLELARFRRRAEEWQVRLLNIARRLRVEDRDWCDTWSRSDERA